MKYLSLETIELIEKYNKTRAKAKKMPKMIRYNAMPKVTTELQLMLDEIQRRATSGDNLLHTLDH
jgi:hypothetical protein